MDQGFTIPILGQGYVRYIDHMGTDQRIVETARISYKSPSKGDVQDKKLLHYLYKNSHSSPFESVNITFNIKMPIFIMRQFIRHRTFRINEVSGRYTEMSDDFFSPELWRGQDTRNKQGSIEISGINQQNVTEKVSTLYQSCYNIYSELLASGVAKEQARIVLPVSLFTEIYVNCDLRNLLNFIRLREDSHAQPEIQEVAHAMHLIAQELFPWTFEAYDKYKVVIQEMR